MISRRPVPQHNRGRIATAGGGFAANDLRGLTSATNLVAWWDAAQGVTMSPTMLPHNGVSASGVPAITLTGDLTSAAAKGLYVQVNKDDSTKFDWNMTNGWGLARAADFGGELAVTIPEGGSYPFPGTGITGNFAVGAYTTAQFWQAAAASITSIVGGASMTLDNSSVYASRGHIIGGPQFFNDYRPSLRVSPFLGTGGMGHVGGLASVVNGTNKPFHIFLVCQITATNISTLSVSPWAFSDTTATTTANAGYLDARWFGPLAASGQRHMVQRHASSSGAAIQEEYSTALGFETTILEYSFDGATVKGFIAGLPMFSEAWTGGALTLHRFMIGAQKFGTLAVGNIPYMDWAECAFYDTALTDEQAAAVRTALAARSRLTVFPDGDVYPDYEPQINPDLAISKSVGGKTLTMATRNDLACGWRSFLWGTDEFVTGTGGKGQALQWAYNIVRGAAVDGDSFTTFTGLDMAPVEQGNRNDSSSSFCASNNYYRGVNAAGDGCLRITNPAMWADPENTSAPLQHSITKLSGFTTASECIIGLSGHDNIVQFNNTITYPTRPELDLYGYEWSLECDLTWYLDDGVFDTCYRVDLETGAKTLVVVTDLDMFHSQTEVFMWQNAGGTLAAAVYSPISSVGANGFHGTRNGTGYSNAFHFRGPSTRQKTGTALHRVFGVFGDEATVVSELMYLFDTYP